MRKTIVYIAILCVILCGCGKEMPLNDFTTGEIETRQSESGSEKEGAEEGTKGEEDPTEILEISTEYVETNEEYIDRMKDIYSEIKSEIVSMGAEKIEVLFHEIPWNSNFLSSKEKINKDGYGNTKLYSEVTYLLGYFVLGNKYNMFDNIISSTEIAGTSYIDTSNMVVAGYDVTECTMCFTGILKDTEYKFSEEDSALYAAYYTIKPENIEKAKEDLKSKISSIYGEPDSARNIEPFKNALTTQEYIYWYGSNNTVLVLAAYDSETISISYAWIGGEELLNAALDYAENGLLESEESVYGDGNTSGL